MTISWLENDHTIAMRSRDEVDVESLEFTIAETGDSRFGYPLLQLFENVTHGVDLSLRLL